MFLLDFLLWLIVGKKGKEGKGGQINYLKLIHAGGCFRLLFSSELQNELSARFYTLPGVDRGYMKAISWRTFISKKLNGLSLESISASNDSSWHFMIKILNDNWFWNLAFSVSFNMSVSLTSSGRTLPSQKVIIKYFLSWYFQWNTAGVPIQVCATVFRVTEADYSASHIPILKIPPCRLGIFFLYEAKLYQTMFLLEIHILSLLYDKIGQFTLKCYLYLGVAKSNDLRMFTTAWLWLKLFTQPYI